MRMDAIPIWVVFAATIIVVTVAIEVGYRLGHAMHGRSEDEKESPVSAIANTMNRVNEVHASRVALGIHARIPGEIWLALYCVTILGTVSVGYQTGIAGSRRSMAWPILALSFALVFALIAALDRPDSGIITVDQQPLIDVRDAMDAATGNASRD